MHAYLNDMKNKRVFYKRTVILLMMHAKKKGKKKYKFSR